jgi:hypothetical protein
MRTVIKYAAVTTLAGALALAVTSPSEARNGRNTAAAVGFAAGALIGAAAANAASSNYYYAPGYYAYEPGYAYEPAPVYVDPGPTYYRPVYSGRCWVPTGGHDQYGYWGSCAAPGARPVK